MLTEVIKAEFLAIHGVKPIKIVRLPQDASNKTYDRIITNVSDQSMLLMHYPDTLENFEKFIATAKLFNENNILAPKVFAHDKNNFLILLQDFGNISINTYLNQKSSDPQIIYRAIIDTLLKIQSINLEPKIQFDYSNQILLQELNITINWYFAYLNVTKTSDLIRQYTDLWQEVLELLPTFEPVFVHRDFHVDNLFKVAASIGVIDFQDWMQGSPIYDLVSLLDDARIFVCQELRDKIVRYYLDLTGFTYDKVMTAYHILGAQKNSRILGVFARKAMQGNGSYVKFIPRVRTYLQNNLESSSQLSSLKKLIYSYNLL